LIPRVQNMSAMYGVDLNQAAIQVGRAMAMGSGALTRYGIVLSDTEKKLFDTGTQMQKVSVLMQVLDANTGNAEEQMASTSSGALAQLKNAFGDVLEEIGLMIDKPVIQYFKNLKDKIYSVVEWFQKLNPQTKEFLGKAILLGSAMVGIVAGLSGIGFVLPSLITGFKTLALVTGKWLLPIVAAVAGVTTLAGLISKLTNKDFGFQQSEQYQNASIGNKIKMILTEGLTEGMSVLTGGLLDLNTTAEVTKNNLDGLKNNTSEVQKQFENLGRKTSKVVEVMDFSGERIEDIGESINESLNGFDFAGKSSNLDLSAMEDQVNAGLTNQQKSDETKSKITNAATGIASAFGEAGGVISNAINAFSKSGDPISAVTSIFATIVSKTKAFGSIMTILGNVLQFVADILNPIMTALTPLLASLAQVGQIKVMFYKNFTIFGAALTGLRYILEGVAKILGAAVNAIEKVWNWIVDKIADCVGLIKDSWAKKIRKNRLTLIDFTQAQEDANNNTNDLNDATVDVTESMKELNKQLLNVPTGFKEFWMRMASIGMEGEGYMVGSASLGGPGAQSNSSIVNINVENVNSNSANDFVDSLNSESEWSNITGSGTTVQSGSYTGGGSNAL